LPFLLQQPFRIYSILFVLYILSLKSQEFVKVLTFRIQNDEQSKDRSSFMVF
jgi:hypothetical protein